MERRPAELKLKTRVLLTFENKAKGKEDPFFTTDPTTSTTPTTSSTISGLVHLRGATKDKIFD